MGTPIAIADKAARLIFYVLVLAAAVTPQTEMAWSNPDEWAWQVSGYGYQWWTGFYEHEGTAIDTYVAWGYGGQWAVAMPSLDLVVVISSNGYDGGDAALNCRPARYGS